jgi:hypothetical protein
MFERRLQPFRAFVIVLCGSAAPSLAQGGLFRDLSLDALPPRGGAWESPLPRRYRALEVDVSALESLLARAPAERSAGAVTSPITFALPYPDGTDRLFRVEESPILEPGLADAFPDIHTFIAQGIDDPTATARLSLTSLGFHAMVLSTAGTVFVDPYRKWDPAYAISYFKSYARRAAGAAPFHCDVRGKGSDLAGVQAAPEKGPESPARVATKVASGTQLRTYRLALAGTGEYSTAVCAPNPVAVSCALNAMVVSMNRVTGVYEREVAIRMVLVANNNLVVYTNGATDPYTNGSGPTMLGENQSNLNSVIGSANYDIGHVFSTGGGGVANLQVPCTSSKARGVTGQPNPVGDPFDIDYVAHEMGHQFGGNHSFNGTTANCGGNRSSGAAYEPGSGTTIMAYAGICGAENTQPHSDDTFHSKNFDEIVSFSTGATGSSCPVITATGNLAPLPSAGPAFTIPKQTPFTLTGSATDPDGDSLTYMWEEFDLGASSSSATIGNGDSDASRPIFRSFVPLTVPSRTFPRHSDILNNTTTIGEWMSTRNRTMTFRMTARDNRAGGSGVNYAATTVTVNAAAGPFAVTQPNSALSWLGSSAQTVTWNVAGTTAAPVSCANVAIDLSTDGGNTFPTSLAASTANDGTQSVSIPNTPTTTARVRVSCVGNVFFDISNANFTITEASGNPPPALQSILPTSGPTTGGTAVTLTGTDFVSGATVLFGAVSATSVTFNSSTSLTATTPAQGAGTVGVTVTNPDTQNATLNAAYTYVAPPPPPGLTSILPTSGPTTGGTAVTLTGSNFVNGATVMFGALAATSVTFNSSTSLTATTPAQGAGAVSVKVTNPDAQNTTLGSAFTYVAGPAGFSFYTLTPCRVVDTRNANGPNGGPALVGGTIRTFAVAGLCGIPADAKSVAVNVTVVQPTVTGNLNVYPAGITPPPTSTISFSAAQIRANNAVLGLNGSTPGSLDVQTNLSAAGTVHFLLDVTGYFK